MKFYKIRALIFLKIIRILSKLFVVQIPPIVSVVAMIKKDGKLLFLKLSYLNGLGLPGGVIEQNESAEDALSREVLEETSLQVTELQYLYSIHSPFRGVPTIALIYEVKVTGQTVPSTEGGLIWLDPEEAQSQLAYESNKKALEKYTKIERQ